MPGALFVITSSADHKLINRLLLHLRDWEYGEAPSWDNFYLITKATLPDSDTVSVTRPPIIENDLSPNVWLGKSISDIESFMINERNKENGLNRSTFIVLDEQGVKDGTIVLLDLPYSDDGEALPEQFNKVRVPWEKTYIMWCNLDIANMNFEDFVEDKDEDQGEWWTYSDDGTENVADVKEKRNNAIGELVQNGLA